VTSEEIQFHSAAHETFLTQKCRQYIWNGCYSQKNYI